MNLLHTSDSTEIIRKSSNSLRSLGRSQNNTPRRTLHQRNAIINSSNNVTDRSLFNEDDEVHIYYNVDRSFDYFDCNPDDNRAAFSRKEAIQNSMINENGVRIYCNDSGVFPSRHQSSASLNRHNPFLASHSTSYGQFLDTKSCSFVNLNNIASTDMNEDNEYGFYNEEMNDAVTDVSDSVYRGDVRQSRSYCTNGDQSSSTTYESIKSGTTTTTTTTTISVRSNSNLKIICELENNDATVVCRSFDKLQVCLSLEGFRVIQDDAGEDAEFKFRICLGCDEFIAWRRFIEFASLAEACKRYSTSITGSSNAQLSTLSMTLTAWNAVIKHRPWWGKNLNASYLITEASLLEEFMKELLNEIPDVSMLMEFVQ
eukprot:gene11001-14775_t